MATTTTASKRYVYEQYLNANQSTRYRVIDSHARDESKYVLRDIINRSAAEGAVEELNAQFREQFAFLQEMLNRFLDSYVEKYPQPWSAQSSGLGVDIKSIDGTQIVNVSAYDQAGWLIEQAKQIELRRFPDGRDK